MRRSLLVGVSFLCLLGCDGPEGSSSALAAAKPPAAASALRKADKTLDQVLAAHAAARGGKDRLLAIKTLRMRGKMTNTRGAKDSPIGIDRKRAGGRFLRRLE